MVGFLGFQVEVGFRSRWRPWVKWGSQLWWGVLGLVGFLGFQVEVGFQVGVEAPGKVGSPASQGGKSDAPGSGVRWGPRVVGWGRAPW